MQQVAVVQSMMACCAYRLTLSIETNHKQSNINEWLLEFPIQTDSPNSWPVWILLVIERE